MPSASTSTRRGDEDAVCGQSSGGRRESPLSRSSAWRKANRSGETGLPCGIVPIRYREFPVDDALAPYVRQILAVRMRPPGPLFGGPERIVADGVVEAIFHYRRPFAMRFRGGGRRGATRQPAGLPDQPLRRDPAGRRRRVRLGALPSVGRAPFLRGSDARGRGSSHARGRGVAPPRCPRGRRTGSRRPRPTRIGPARCRRFCGGRLDAHRKQDVLGARAHAVEDARAAAHRIASPARWVLSPGGGLERDVSPPPWA